MRLLNKKGISPLIATVLLVGFTVALTGVVIIWGSGFIEKITSGTEERTDVTLACTSELKFEIKNVVCDDNGAGAGGVSKITIENKGSVKIDEIKLRFFNIAGGISGASQTLGVVDKYDIKDFSLAALIPVTTTKVEGLATVTIDGKTITCGEYVQENTVSPAC